MQQISEILEKHGLAGLVIAGLVFVIWKYMLPSFERIATTNAKQAESLVEVSQNLAKIHSEIPKEINAAKEEILKKIDDINKE